MERLTQRENDRLIMVKQDNGEYIPAYWDEDNFKAIKKLADYEDLEEQGLLVRLPVPLGSKVYCISTRDKQNSIIFEKNFVLGMLYFWDSTVFATREEAEKKLRRSWRR